MAVILDDTRDLLEALRDCLCTALAGSVPGEACRCCIVHGAAATWWDCSRGQAWVRLVQLASPPVSASKRKCLPVSNHVRVNATVELGVLRCAPQPDEGALAPTCEQIAASNVEVLADMETMYSMPACCALPSETAFGNYTPMGPMGGCVGGNLHLVVPAWLCTDCPSPAESPPESPPESP